MTAMEELKKSPLFALSLCSKELAHSNFWWWLITEIEYDGEHPFAEMFLHKDWTYVSAKREEAHRDITIYYEDSNGEKNCHIIENKIKTLPTKSQLKKYEEDYRNKKYSFAGGTLTGIEGSLDLSKTNWKFKSYDEIATSIDNILNNI